MQGINKENLSSITLGGDVVYESDNKVSTGAWKTTEDPDGVFKFRFVIPFVGLTLDRLIYWALKGFRIEMQARLRNEFKSRLDIEARFAQSTAYEISAADLDKPAKRGGQSITVEQAVMSKLEAGDVEGAQTLMDTAQDQVARIGRAIEARLELASA